MYVGWMKSTRWSPRSYCGSTFPATLSAPNMPSGAWRSEVPLTANLAKLPALPAQRGHQTLL